MRSPGLSVRKGGVNTDSRSLAKHLARVEVSDGERGASVEETGGAGDGGDPESTVLSGRIWVWAVCESV